MDQMLLSAAARRYDIPPSHLEPLSGGTFSHVYAFSRQGSEYVLRITPPNDEIDDAAMRGIVSWVHYLAAQGASVSAPLPSVHGDLVEHVDSSDVCYLVAAFERAQGILGEELPFELWSDALLERLGHVAGRMHALAKTYCPAEPSLRRPEWTEVGNCFKPTGVPALPPAVVVEKHEAALRQVLALPHDSESYGLIHTDLHSANYYVDPDHDTITVFDFDDCSYGWYAMDIAMSLFDLVVLYPGQDKEAFASRFLACYLAGYLAETHLADEWIGRLGLFLKLLEIGVYLQTYAYADPDDSGSWVAKFLADRQRRIEHDAPFLDMDAIS